MILTSYSPNFPFSFSNLPNKQTPNPKPKWQPQSTQNKAKTHGTCFFMGQELLNVRPTLKYGWYNVTPLEKKWFSPFPAAIIYKWSRVGLCAHFLFLEMFLRLGFQWQPLVGLEQWSLDLFRLTRLWAAQLGQESWSLCSLMGSGCGEPRGHQVLQLTALGFTQGCAIRHQWSPHSGDFKSQALIFLSYIHTFFTRFLIY